MRRIGIASSLVLAAALLTETAGAARVVDVRVGRHPDYTRVVIELDEPADYTLRAQEHSEGGEAASELVLELEASGAFAMARPQGIVESIRIAPRGSGSQARIRLSTPRPAVREMVLSAPPRIVLDLRPAPEEAGAGEAAPAASKEAAAPAGAPEGDTGAPGSEGAVGARAGAGTGEPASAKGTEKGSAPPATGAPERAAAASAGARPASGAGATATAGAAGTGGAPGQAEPRAAAGGATPVAPQEPAAPSGAPGAPAPEGTTAKPTTSQPTTPGASPAAKAAAGAARTTGEREARSAARRPETRAERSAPSPSAGRPSQPPAATSSWSDLLGDPRLVWMIVGIVVLFVIWGILRRRARSHAERSEDFPPVPPAEEPLQPALGDAEGADTLSERDVVRPEAGDETPAPGSRTHGAGAGTAPGLGAGAASREGGAPEEQAETGREIAEEEPDLPSIPGMRSGVGVMGVTSPRSGASPATAQDDGGAPGAQAVAELERRLHVLESRVEELVDGRERAERQLAAHTEELRVQRSAIARAQRVLRTLTRPDEATEPVPRGPSQEPGA